MSQFQTAVQDCVAALRHGTAEQVGARFHEVMTFLEQAGPEEATWALLAVVELLADPQRPHQGFLAVLAERFTAHGASPWVASGLIVERLCEFLKNAATSAEELDLLCRAAAPQLQHFAEARHLCRVLGEPTDRLRHLATSWEGAQAVLEVLEQHKGEPFLAVPLGAAAEAALRQVAEVSARGAEARDETFNQVQEMMRALFCVDMATRNRILAGVGQLIADRDPIYAGEFTQLCGSMVEIGCDPLQAIDPVLVRLPELLESAASFLNACLEAAQEEEATEEEKGPWDLVEAYGPKLAATLPTEARAWEAVGPMCLGTIALLARAPAKRKQVREDTDLLMLVRALAGANGSAAFLTRMLQVLDDEELLVLAPEPQVGFRIRIGGIGDNFQLHTLLAGAIVGPAKEGLYPGIVGTIHEGHAEPSQPGRPLNPRAIGVARDLPCTREEASIYSHLQLWTWEALQPSGRLPDDPIANHDVFVWNEGVPADIPLFEGVRVILLGSVSFSRSWNGGRVFPFMSADLRVEEKLPPEVVADWLQRIKAASMERG